MDKAWQGVLASVGMVVVMLVFWWLGLLDGAGWCNSL